MDAISGSTMVNAIAGAPIWVWGILGYLLFVGMRATRTRIVYIPKLFIIPAIFMVLNYKALVSGEYVVLDLGFMLIGLLIGLVVAKNTTIKTLKKLKSIELPGGYSTVVILLLFFITKYIFGYLEAMQPSTAIQYSYVDTYTSTLFSGFFLGKSLCYLYRFYYDK